MGELLLSAPETGPCLAAEGLAGAGSAMIPRTAEVTGSAWTPAGKANS